MSQSSALRSFATTAEFVAGLMPRLAHFKITSKSEAELLATRLKSGAETALDIAIKMERGSDAPDLLDPLKDLIRIAEAVRYTAGLGKGQLERVEKAKVAAAEAEVALTTGNGTP